MAEAGMDLVILGSGGLAKEAAFVVEEINRLQPGTWNLLGFVDAAPEKLGKHVRGYPVLGDDAWLLGLDQPVSVISAIGTPAVIRKLKAKLERAGHLSFPNIIHPSLIRDRKNVRLGSGNLFLPGVLLTTDISIGSWNVFNPNVNIGHDTSIGDCCVLNPGCNISGGLRIGNGVLVGAGATILQYLEVADGLTLGAGAVLTRSVAEQDLVMAGVPARILRRA